MKAAAIYVRGSTADQHVESQLYDLRELAVQRGLEVVQEYTDCGVSGKRARRPGLDALIADARKKKFSVVLVAAFDRVARRVKHFLQDWKMVRASQEQDRPITADMTGWIPATPGNMALGICVCGNSSSSGACRWFQELFCPVRHGHPRRDYHCSAIGALSNCESFLRTLSATSTTAPPKNRGAEEPHWMSFGYIAATSQIIPLR